MNRLKTGWLFFVFVLPVVCIFSQNTRIDMGNYYFSLSPKVLKNGSITDIALGYYYTESAAGELRFRFSFEKENTRFSEDIADSLNAVSSQNYEAYVLPFKYSFIKKDNLFSSIGAGVYYNYSTTAEKGYFILPVLEELGKEKVNSFANESSMHLLGPVIQAELTRRVSWFDFTFNIGAAPLFYLYARQKMEIIPLLEPHSAEITQHTWGSPYVYADMSCMLFNFISLQFFYDISALTYDVLDFKEQCNNNLTK